MSGEQERTEQATARRKERSRAQGQSARSAFAAAAFGLAAAVAPAAAVVPFAGWWVALLHRDVSAGVAAVHDGPQAILGPALAVMRTGGLWGPIGAAWAAAATGALAASAACGGIAVSLAALRPSWGRLSPSAGLKRIVSPDGFVAVVLSAACIALIGWAARPAVASAVATGVLDLPFPSLAAAAATTLAGLWWRIVAVAGLIAVADVALQRRRFTTKLRMTPREVRDERIETDGKPETKARRRAVGARRVRALSIAAIRRATAVVTNPTHVAVALRYAPPRLDVPVVVARGAGLAAGMVRAAAEMHDVPIMESPDLARALYARVDVDGPIPEECYVAVAAVFAWILRTRGRLGGAEEASPR